MRIIAGRAKGHILKAPKGMSTRPTQDRVRESIFNILTSYGLIESTVLDFFFRYRRFRIGSRQSRCLTGRMR